MSSQGCQLSSSGSLWQAEKASMHNNNRKQSQPLLDFTSDPCHRLTTGMWKVIDQSESHAHLKRKKKPANSQWVHLPGPPFLFVWCPWGSQHHASLFPFLLLFPLLLFLFPSHFYWESQWSSWTAGREGRGRSAIHRGVRLTLVADRMEKEGHSQSVVKSLQQVDRMEKGSSHFVVKSLRHSCTSLSGDLTQCRAVWCPERVTWWEHAEACCGHGKMLMRIIEFYLWK